MKNARSEDVFEVLHQFLTFSTKLRVSQVTGHRSQIKVKSLFGSQEVEVEAEEA